MNRVNYNREMEQVISDIVKTGVKPKLILHACCAPCASTCIERLKEAFEIIVCFYNPNINTKEEYLLRAEELKRLCDYFGVNCLIEDYGQSDFISQVKGLEKEKEGGLRCEKCFNLRLKETAVIGKQQGFSYFATTLTLSPLKNCEKINSLGLEIEKNIGVKYLVSDFKKKNGYIRSLELSNQLNLYRQNYCGCAFSIREAKL